MENHEVPRTMVRFLQLITGKIPHVVIEGPMEQAVPITRLVAQGLFRSAAAAGYETRIFSERGPSVILKVQQTKQ